jgi:hypothetical protein
MARPPVADAEDLQIWRAAVNIFNKQSWTADKGWSFTLGVVRGLKTLHRKRSFVKKCNMGGLGIVSGSL